MNLSFLSRIECGILTICLDQCNRFSTSNHPILLDKCAYPTQWIRSIQPPDSLHSFQCVHSIDPSSSHINQEHSVQTRTVGPRLIFEAKDHEGRNCHPWTHYEVASNGFITNQLHVVEDFYLRKECANFPKKYPLFHVTLRELHCIQETCLIPYDELFDSLLPVRGIRRLVLSLFLENSVPFLV